MVDCSRVVESPDEHDTMEAEFDAPISDVEVEEDSPILCDSNSDEDVHEEPQTTLLSASSC